MTELGIDLALRLGKVVVATGLAIVFWLLAVGPLGAAGSPQLALLCWLSGAALVLLVESSPL